MSSAKKITVNIVIIFTEVASPIDILLDFKFKTIRFMLGRTMSRYSSKVSILLTLFTMLAISVIPVTPNCSFEVFVPLFVRTSAFPKYALYFEMRYFLKLSMTRLELYYLNNASDLFSIN